MDDEVPPTTEELEKAAEEYLDDQRNPPDYEDTYLKTRGEMTPPPHEWPGGDEEQDAADEVPTP